MRSLCSVYGYLKRIAAVQALRQGRQDAPSLAMLLPELRLQLQRIHDPLAWAGDVRKRMDAAKDAARALLAQRPEEISIGLDSHVRAVSEGAAGGLGGGGGGCGCN